MIPTISFMQSGDWRSFAADLDIIGRIPLERPVWRGYEGAYDDDPAEVRQVLKDLRSQD